MEVTGIHCWFGLVCSFLCFCDFFCDLVSSFCGNLAEKKDCGARIGDLNPRLGH